MSFSASNSKLGRGMTAPNSLVGRGMSAPNHRLGKGRVCARPHDQARVHSPPTLRWTRARPRPTPCWAPFWAWTCPRPTIYWARDASTPNFMLSMYMSAPNPMLGEGRDHTIAPYWAVARSSLTILECSHEKDPTPPGLRV